MPHPTPPIVNSTLSTEEGAGDIRQPPLGRHIAPTGAGPSGSATGRPSRSWGLLHYSLAVNRSEDDQLVYGYFCSSFQITTLANALGCVERVSFCRRMAACETWEELRGLLSDDQFEAEVGEFLKEQWEIHNGWDAYWRWSPKELKKAGVELVTTPRPDDWYPDMLNERPWPYSEEWVEEESWINTESIVRDLPSAILDLGIFNSIDQVHWDPADLPAIRELATELGLQLVERQDLFSKAECLDLW